MKKKLQVFVSSTFTDMRDERQAAVEAILRAGHIPAGMELFASSDEAQMDVIRRWIDESDVFMLILGGRYGMIEPKSGKSYVETEYEYALKKRKRLFAAVMADSAIEAKAAAHGQAVKESDHGALLKAFRVTVMSKICRQFSDLNELKLIVLESMLRYGDENLPGWVRSTDVVDPAPLQTENARLREQLATVEKRLADLPSVVRAAAADSSYEPSEWDLLSDEAQTLLKEAAPSGHITCHSDGGTQVIAAGQATILPHDAPHKTSVYYLAGLKELVGERYVVSHGQTRNRDPGLPAVTERYSVTKQGYDLLAAAGDHAK